MKEYLTGLKPKSEFRRGSKTLSADYTIEVDGKPVEKNKHQKAKCKD